MTAQKVNEEHFAQWIAALRSGQFAQGQEFLVTKRGEEVRYCCLGVGCTLVSNLDPHWIEPDEEHGLAPADFIDWLGVRVVGRDILTGAEEFDLHLDYPTDTLPPRGGLMMTAAALNDSGFTFDQIADMFEFFGIREAA